MTIDDGYPSDDLPLDRRLKDGRTVSTTIADTVALADRARYRLDKAYTDGKRADLIAAERNLERALTELRTIRYAT